jgi:predicted regulator of amino acid metabolism with ACT domain
MRSGRWAFIYTLPTLMHMWEDILQIFADSPSQSRVVRFFLENGFGVNENGRVVCNEIEIPATQIAKATGTDRRVVDATAQTILSTPDLREVFLNMRVTPDISRVAETLGKTVITVLPINAQQKGIIGSVVKVLTDHELGIRQIFVTDPLLSEEPKLVVIVDETVPPAVYEELKSLSQVRKLII